MRRWLSGGGRMGFGLLACESSLTGPRFETRTGQLRVAADLKLGQWMIVGWCQGGKHCVTVTTTVVGDTRAVAVPVVMVVVNTQVLIKRNRQSVANEG